MEISLDEFVKDYLGKSKGYPTDSQYKGECLSICKLYIKECFGIEPPPSGTNSAYGYWTNFPNPLGEKFEKVKNTIDVVPEKGWIVIWKPWDSNGYGHIAIIKSATKNNFVSYDQNWGTKNFVEINHDYNNVIGFLKPKSSIIEDMTDNEKKILGIVNENKLTEGDIRWLVDLKKNETVSNLEKNVEALNFQLEAVNSKLAELEAKFVENQKVTASQQKELTTANDKIVELNGTIENIKTESNSWQSRYNSKNTDFNTLSTEFEEYKKTHGEVTTFDLVAFIKSLFKK